MWLTCFRLSAPDDFNQLLSHPASFPLPANTGKAVTLSFSGPSSEAGNSFDNLASYSSQGGWHTGVEFGVGRLAGRWWRLLMGHRTATPARPCAARHPGTQRTCLLPRNSPASHGHTCRPHSRQACETGHSGPRHHHLCCPWLRRIQLRAADDGGGCQAGRGRVGSWAAGDWMIAWLWRRGVSWALERGAVVVFWPSTPLQRPPQLSARLPHTHIPAGHLHGYTRGGGVGSAGSPVLPGWLLPNRCAAVLRGLFTGSLSRDPGATHLQYNWLVWCCKTNECMSE